MAEEDASKIAVKTFNGSVISVDKENNSMIFQTVEGDLELKIPLNAKIFRETEETDFGHIEKGDVAWIDYYQDKSGTRHVLKIVLE